MEELRRRLLEAVDRRRGEVLAKNWGYERPDPGKLVREGLSIAERCIKAVPVTDPAWLATVIKALTDAKSKQDACGISDDGWDDEDGWILGGIASVIGDAQKMLEGQR